MYKIANEFESNIINIYGTRGKTWLQNLPQLVKEIANEWNLSRLIQLENLSYNYVMSGFYDAYPVILKISPDEIALEREAMALQHFKGFGCMRVFRRNTTAILIEKAVPGSSLKLSNEDEAIEIVCNIIKKLTYTPIPKDSIFPFIKDLLRQLDSYCSVVSSNEVLYYYLQKAISTKNQLLTTTGKQFFLHGDLHHDNILQHNNKWCFIDPKGVIGNLEFDVATFIYNPIPGLLTMQDAIGLINKRIITFAKQLQLDQDCIRQWCFVKSVLCWVWAHEDGINCQYFQKIAYTFDNLIFS